MKVGLRPLSQRCRNLVCHIVVSCIALVNSASCLERRSLRRKKKRRKRGDEKGPAEMVPVAGPMRPPTYSVFGTSL